MVQLEEHSEPPTLAFGGELPADILHGEVLYELRKPRVFLEHGLEAGITSSVFDDDGVKEVFLSTRRPLS